VDVTAAVTDALERHLAVGRVRLVGSRAEGRAHPLSDWDFVVETDDFESVELALPTLVAPLEPIAAQWDPYSDHACYMLMLRGPTKVDLFFPNQPRAWSDAWVAAPETLEGIDHHFWDWILWLEQKRAGGCDEVVAKSLGDMYRLLLAPMGATAEPHSIGEALDLYLTARSEREREFGAHVPRELEHEALSTVHRGADSP
jgi:hypothetical protein